MYISTRLNGLHDALPIVNLPLCLSSPSRLVPRHFRFEVLAADCSASLYSRLILPRSRLTQALLTTSWFNCAGYWETMPLNTPSVLRSHAVDYLVECLLDTTLRTGTLAPVKVKQLTCGCPDKVIIRKSCTYTSLLTPWLSAIILHFLHLPLAPVACHKHRSKCPPGQHCHIYTNAGHNIQQYITRLTHYSTFAWWQKPLFSPVVSLDELHTRFR